MFDQEVPRTASPFGFCFVLGFFSPVCDLPRIGGTVPSVALDGAFVSLPPSPPAQKASGDDEPAPE